MNRLIAIVAVLALVAVVAIGWSIASSSAPLTADEWAWCQGHWRDGLDPSQLQGPKAGTWYFDHMGFREGPDTIRVCRAAASKR